MNVDLKEIQALIRMLDETDVADLSLESDGVKIHIRKANAPVETPKGAADAVEPAVAAEPASDGAAEVDAAPSTGRADDDAAANWVEVKAPVVGTFYRAPAPDAPPFIDVGDQVREGQTLCIVEAMKIMNEIPADSAGRIRRILVEDGKPVEYGQPLFLMEPN